MTTFAVKPFARSACVTAMLLLTRVALALPAGTPPAAGRGMTGVTIDSPGLAGPAFRMIASLAAVLALVGGLAWLAQKLRNGGRARSGLIEILSGVSLGTRDRVVLLRVGDEQVLVGVSPSGMRALHVLPKPNAAPSFGEHMEAQGP